MMWLPVFFCRRLGRAICCFRIQHRVVGALGGIRLLSTWFRVLWLTFAIKWRRKTVGRAACSRGYRIGGKRLLEACDLYNADGTVRRTGDNYRDDSTDGSSDSGAFGDVSGTSGAYGASGSGDSG